MQTEAKGKSFPRRNFVSCVINAEYATMRYKILKKDNWLDSFSSYLYTKYNISHFWRHCILTFHCPRLSWRLLLLLYDYPLPLNIRDARGGRRGRSVLRTTGDADAAFDANCGFAIGASFSVDFSFTCSSSLFLSNSWDISQRIEAVFAVFFFFLAPA